MSRPTAKYLFRDMLFNVLLLFVAVTLILLPHINPVQEETKEKVPGDMSINMVWPSGNTSDIDLWLRPPDGEAVGFNRTAGQYANLLRDDLGLDLMPANFENIYSRGLPDGLYVVNVHYYRGGGPVSVDVEITVRWKGKKTKLHRRVVLEGGGAQTTIYRLRIFQGEIMSQDTIYEPIVTAKGGNSD